MHLWVPHVVVPETSSAACQEKVLPPVSLLVYKPCIYIYIYVYKYSIYIYTHLFIYLLIYLSTYLLVYLFVYILYIYIIILYTCVLYICSIPMVTSYEPIWLSRAHLADLGVAIGFPVLWSQVCTLLVAVSNLKDSMFIHWLVISGRKRLESTSQNRLKWPQNRLHFWT